MDVFMLQLIMIMSRILENLQIVTKKSLLAENSLTMSTYRPVYGHSRIKAVTVYLQTGSRSSFV